MYAYSAQAYRLQPQGRVYQLTRLQECDTWKFFENQNLDWLETLLSLSEAVFC